MEGRNRATLRCSVALFETYRIFARIGSDSVKEYASVKVAVLAVVIQLLALTF